MAHKKSSALFLLLAILHISPAVQGIKSSYYQLQGSLTWVTANELGEVWGVNAQQNVYKYEKVFFGAPKWVQKPGKLVQISAGASGVWGVNANNEIYTWVPGISNWQKVPGSLTRVSSGSRVVGVNSVGNVYIYNGNGQWSPVDGNLVDISVGDGGNWWGVNSQDQVYRREGQSWVQMPGSLKTVTVGSQGVFGINAADQVYFWTGGYWVKIPGSLRQIDSGSVIMCVDGAGRIYEMT